MPDINEYFYGCLMWAKAVSRLDDTIEKKFTNDEIQHFHNIVARLSKFQTFDRKQFEADVRTVLKSVRIQIDVFGPAYYADEDGFWSTDDDGRDYEMEQDILNHFRYCICNKIIFPREASMISNDKLIAASEMMITKYTVDTITGIIPFTTNDIPWRTEYSVGELFKNAYQVSLNFGKTTLFGRDKAAPFYDKCMVELGYLIKEMKFEGLILNSMNIEDVCQAIIVRCGVAELTIKAESNDRRLVEICSGAMFFIMTFFNNKDVSHKIIAQLYK
jgi:hypothetical protein